MRVVYKIFIGVVLGVVVTMTSSCGAAVKMCKQPELDLPEEVVAGALDSLSLADVAWWEFYGDEVLTKFISHALENNKDILRSVAKVEQMRQLNRMERTAWVPSLSASAMADR